MSEHTLKVIPPYFDAILDGTKTFEVRKNDRAYQRGDILHLSEWHPEQTNSARRCDRAGCNYSAQDFGHWAQDKRGRPVVHREVTFVFSGDPRFPGVEPGYVVLALGPAFEGVRRG